MRRLSGGVWPFHLVSPWLVLNRGKEHNLELCFWPETRNTKITKGDPVGSRLSHLVVVYLDYSITRCFSDF